MSYICSRPVTHFRFLRFQVCQCIQILMWQTLCFDRPSISFQACMHTVPEAKPSYGRMRDTVKAEKIVCCSLYSYAFPVPVSTARHALPRIVYDFGLFWSSALKLKVHLYSSVFGQTRKVDHARGTDRSYSNASYSSRSHISVSCWLACIGRTGTHQIKTWCPIFLQHFLLNSQVWEDSGRLLGVRDSVQ